MIVETGMKARTKGRALFVKEREASRSTIRSCVEPPVPPSALPLLLPFYYLALFTPSLI